MQFAFLLALGLGAVACGTVPESQPSSSQSAQETRLRNDAVALAAYLYWRSEADPEALPVSPSVALVDSIHAGLVSIFRLEHPARDTVFELHEIPPFVEGLHEALVRVDSAAPWLDAWAAGRPDTGVPGIDSILGPLVVVSVEELMAMGDLRSFGLAFQQPANWHVLRHRLVQVPALRTAGPRFFIVGRGNHIVLERARGSWRFTFTVGWGDCLSGCANRRNWVFLADTKGRAEFLGSSGDPLPRRPLGDSL